MGTAASRLRGNRQAHRAGRRARGKERSACVVPLFRAPILAALGRAIRRTAFVRAALLLALAAALAAGAAAAREPEVGSAGLVPSGTNVVVVLDASASVQGSSRIADVLPELYENPNRRIRAALQTLADTRRSGGAGSVLRRSLRAAAAGDAGTRARASAPVLRTPARGAGFRRRPDLPGEPLDPFLQRRHADLRRTLEGARDAGTGRDRERFHPRC